MPHGKMIVNFNEKIFVPNEPLYFVVTESDYTPFENDAFHPTTFETGCNCNIHLNTSYCCIGVSRFKLIQTGGFKAVIYDKHGELLFDGTNQEDGAYQFECTMRPLTVDDYAGLHIPNSTLNVAIRDHMWKCYNGKNDKWTVTKLQMV